MKCWHPRHGEPVPQISNTTVTSLVASKTRPLLTSSSSASRLPSASFLASHTFFSFSSACNLRVSSSRAHARSLENRASAAFVRPACSRATSDAARTLASIASQRPSSFKTVRERSSAGEGQRLGTGHRSSMRGVQAAMQTPGKRQYTCLSDFSSLGTNKWAILHWCSLLASTGPPTETGEI